MASVTIRAAEPRDVADIHRLLLAFGRHWTHEDWVTSTPETLDKALFGPDHKGFGHVAERDGQILGVALWFMAFNFWMTEPVLFLEDLFVDEAARGSGTGEALIKALAVEAVSCDCAWMEWIVRADNIASQRFYARHGGQHMAEYGLWRLEGDALQALAGAGAEAGTGAEAGAGAA